MLADVPCSGDGTIRKDPSVLPRWSPAVSNQIHATQLEIGWRAVQLLRVGGVLAYSTCSLNPVEDEAVVAALLQCAGSGDARWPEVARGASPRRRRCCDARAAPSSSRSGLLACSPGWCAARVRCGGRRGAARAAQQAGSSRVTA